MDRVIGPLVSELQLRHRAGLEKRHRPPEGAGRSAVFYLLLFCERQCPRILAADNSFKRGIVTTPGQSEVTSVIVEETLIAKSSMVWIRLVEYVRVTTRRTFNDCVLQVGRFAHIGFYRLTRTS